MSFSFAAEHIFIDSITACKVLCLRWTTSDLWWIRCADRASIADSFITPHWLGWLLHWTNSGKLLLRAFCIACCIAAASHSVAQCFTRSKILLSTFRCTATTTPPCVPLSFSRFLLLFSFLLFFVSSFLRFFLLRFNSGPNIKLSVRHLYTSQYVIDSGNRRRGLALSSFLLVCTTLRSQPPGLCGCVQRAELLWPWSFLSCHNRAANTHYTPANQHTTPYDTTR